MMTGSFCGWEQGVAIVAFGAWVVRGRSDSYIESEGLSSARTVVKHLRAQLVFPRAAAAGGPLKPRITNLANAGEVREFLQRAGQDGFVARAVMRRTEGAPHGMIDENCARRRDFAHDIERRADDQSRNALGLDDMGDETDGLMAKGSVGYEQRQIDLRFRQFVGDRRCEVGLD